MRFEVLCDVHIAFKIVKFFESKGHEAIHVNNILDSYNSKDSEISRYADEYGFVVITKDVDFKDSHFIQSKPKKLLHVTLGNIPTKKLIEILDKNLSDIVAHFQSESCYVELNNGYIKVISS